MCGSFKTYPFFVLSLERIEKLFNDLLLLLLLFCHIYQFMFEKIYNSIKKKHSSFVYILFHSIQFDSIYYHLIIPPSFPEYFSIEIEFD